MDDKTELDWNVDAGILSNGLLKIADDQGGRMKVIANGVPNPKRRVRVIPLRQCGEFQVAPMSNHLEATGRQQGGEQSLGRTAPWLLTTTDDMYRLIFCGLR